MPKIEVDEQAFYRLAGRAIGEEELEPLLAVAKAELDGREPGLLKIELNDTNRPDLWSTAGLARALRVYLGGAIPSYRFFSRRGAPQETGGRSIVVDAALESIRPYIAAFAVAGRSLDEAGLKDLIQTQEKLCWNFGRKRSSIAMGVYSSARIAWPVRYLAADPDATRFVPLGLDSPLSLRRILRDHPKGREFGHLVERFARFPYLADDGGAALSFPPIINSAGLGAVKAGDRELFVELTGTDLRSLLVAASIVACDLCDQGFTILPVAVRYPYDTELGREIVTPFYFQEPVAAESAYAGRLLGVELTAEEAVRAVGRMGCVAAAEGGRITVTVPEYRNDFLHAVDVVEDIMMARGVDAFPPLSPADFTVGRLSPIESLSRRARDLMVGLGYQEMIFNYLGSRRDYCDRMGLPPDGMVSVANPMSESYELVRSSILPALLASEAVSSRAQYPHLIFEIGKVALLDDSDLTGTVTRDNLALLIADREAGFNEVRAHLAAVFYYLGRECIIERTSDPRFIAGRCAGILLGGRRIGLLGEIHPQVLDNWGIQAPCAAAEIDLGALL